MHFQLYKEAEVCSCRTITTHTWPAKNLEQKEREREIEKGSAVCWIVRDIAVIYGVTIPYGKTPLAQIMELAFHCIVTIPLLRGYFVDFRRPVVAWESVDST